MTVSDLSPDALSRLEAKLVADLEMVRKVRALLEEHGGSLRMTAPVAVSVQVTPSIPATPATPRKTLDDILLESLAALPEAGFTVGDLKGKLRKAGCDPRDGTVKTFLNRMIRKGKVRVIEARTGRGGSTYGHTVSLGAAVESPSVLPEKAPGQAVLQAQSPV